MNRFIRAEYSTTDSQGALHQVTVKGTRQATLTQAWPAALLILR